MSLSEMLAQIIAEEDAKELEAMNNHEYPSCSINPVAKLQEIYEQKNQKTLSDFTGDYTSAIKMRLSGLSEKSAGNGVDKRTVIHAIAITQISKSRFTRQPRQFLCTTKGAKEYGVGERVGDKVDCQRCKSIIQLHGLSVCNDEDLGRLINSY